MEYVEYSLNLKCPQHTSTPKWCPQAKAHNVEVWYWSLQSVWKWAGVYVPFYFHSNIIIWTRIVTWNYIIIASSNLLFTTTWMTLDSVENKPLPTVHIYLVKMHQVTRTYRNQSPKWSALSWRQHERLFSPGGGVGACGGFLSEDHCYNPRRPFRPRHVNWHMVDPPLMGSCNQKMLLSGTCILLQAGEIKM